MEIITQINDAVNGFAWGTFGLALLMGTGLMMIPNMIGVLSQLPLIIKLTKNYTDRRIKGKDIEPLLSYDSDIQAEALRAIQKGAD